MVRRTIFKTPPSHYLLVCATVCLLLLTGCTLDMRQQPKVKPLRSSDFFLDGQSARPFLPDTVARGHLNLDTELYTGKTKDGNLVEKFPIEITPELMARGRER